MSKLKHRSIILLLLAQLLLWACTEQIPNQITKNSPETSLANMSPFNALNSRLLGTDGFSSTLYPLLVDNCANCHGTDGMALPLLAHGDINIAQAEIIDNQKINFPNPGNSRIVKKLQEEFHYCWSLCQDDALQLQTEITQWKDLTTSVGIIKPPADILSSQPLTLADGVLGAGTSRYDADVIAFYEFKEGTGNVTKDTSGVLPALNLTLEGTVWTAGQGIKIQSGIAVGTAEASHKLYDIIAGSPSATKAYSIETWVIPDNVTQEGPARLVTYSDGTQLRNFTMGQQNYNYVFRNRTDSPDISQNGTPSLHTKNMDQVLQANQQHVVMTFDQQTGRKIYVNGILKREENVVVGSLNNWSPNHIFAIGNEVTNNRLFQGVFQLVAIHKSSLTSEQVLQNFSAGVGEKFVMQFGVDPLNGLNSNYIQFEVSELDNYSYLFSKPIFITNNPNGFQIKNIQISVNGQIPVAGQTWKNINTTITLNEQPLSNLAAIISKDLGPDQDRFSIIFEALGDKKTATVIIPPTEPTIVDIIDTAPRTGLRTFEQITHTMAALTGVNPNNGNINRTYRELEQQLPSLPDINGFLASHQVGIAKLALDYCDTLIDSPTLRDNFFGMNTFNFNAPVSDAFANTNQTTELVNTLVDNMFGINLSNQPDNLFVKQEIMALITDLTSNCNTPAACDATKTKSVIKGSCAAMLGSAAIVIQ